MTGDELEQLLSRYRPVGPPPDLRARILRSASADERVALPIWLAISALAACAVLFVGGASRVYSNAVQAEAAELRQERDAEIATTAVVLGGGNLGREQAVEAITLAERDSVTPDERRDEARRP